MVTEILNKWIKNLASVSLRNKIKNNDKTNESDELKSVPPSKKQKKSNPEKSVNKIAIKT